MSITTYAELQTAVSSWLDRDDLDAIVPDFIALAEPEIFDDLRIRQMQTRADVTIDAEYVAVESDFIEAIRFYVDDSPIHKMEYRSPDQMLSVMGQTADKPDYYTVIGEFFQFDVTPSGSFTGKLSYYFKPGALTDSNTTNVVLTNYPNIYLYGALKQAEPYLGNDPRVALWLQMYDLRVRKANTAAKNASYGGSALQAIAG